MFKKFLSIALSAMIMATLAIPASAEDSTSTSAGSNGSQIVNYDFKNETLEESKVTRAKPATGDDAPWDPPARSSANTIIDESAHAEFKAAGLVDESGEFDWDALSKLPTLDTPDDTATTEGDVPISITEDDRKKVTSTTTSPYKYTVYMLMNYNGSYYRGSGFVVGNSAVGTCGHNVHNSDRGWATSVTVIPCRNGDNYPYGSTTVTRLRSNTGWTQQANAEDDWALVETDSDISSYTGYCGIRNVNADIVNSAVTVVGYPKDTWQESNSSSMWYGNGNAIRQNGLRLYFDTYVSGGNSGGPVFSNGAYVAAIVGYQNFSLGHNGRRVDDSIRSLYMEYR